MKLGSEYKLYTISQNTTLNIDDLIDDCMNFLRDVELDQETSEKLSKVEQKLRQAEKLENTDKIYKHKKKSSSRIFLIFSKTFLQRDVILGHIRQAYRSLVFGTKACFT